jgi:hypothetical protein
MNSGKLSHASGCLSAVGVHFRSGLIASGSGEKCEDDVELGERRFYFQALNKKGHNENLCL